MVSKWNSVRFVGSLYDITNDFNTNIYIFDVQFIYSVFSYNRYLKELRWLTNDSYNAQKCRSNCIIKAMLQYTYIYIYTFKRNLLSLVS